MESPVKQELLSPMEKSGNYEMVTAFSKYLFMILAAGISASIAE